MPGIDLSTLTAPELRQLLRLARARRDGLLIDRLEWEMAQRAALSSRVGFTVERKPTVVIEDGDVTIDEVRAFRRPEPGLPARRTGGGGRLAAGLGGLVAGSVLTAGAFAAAQGTDGWRLPAQIELPALPAFAVAERTPPPRPPVALRTANSDAVAGALAPEPFPEIAVAEPPAPPPEPVAPPPEPLVEAVAVAEAAPEPKPQPRAAKAEAKPKAKPAKAKTEQAKAKPKKPVALAEAKVKPSKGEKAKAKTAKAKPKTEVASAKSKVKAKAGAKAKAETKLAAKAKPTKTAEAKSKTKAKPAAKTALAKKDAKPAPKPPAKSKPQVAQHDAIGVLLAQAADGAARNTAARE